MNNELPITQPQKSGNPLWIFLAFLLGVCLLIAGLTSCFGLAALGMGGIQKLVYNVTRTQETFAANATATHEALVNDRATYGFTDSFDDNSNGWSTGSYDDQYFKGEVKVADGFYTWDIVELKKDFMHNGLIESSSLYMSDFDVYVDGSSHQGDPNGYCYGIRFRTKLVETFESYYGFFICDAGTYSIYYVDEATDTWLSFMSSEYTQAVRTGDWNTLGVTARGNHLKFLINDWTVHELDDDKLSAGGIELMVVVNGDQPGSISFDNFAVQGR